MDHEHPSVDISGMPELAQLADEVARTKRPCILRRGADQVAVLVPVSSPKRPRRRTGGSSDLSLDALVGAAGSLPYPLEWSEIKRIVRDERADAYRAKHQ
jgi:hypothetical protein